MNFDRTITALVSPMIDGKIDYKSLEKVINHQLEGGVNGFVINGTTGESPTLLENERKEIFKFVRELVGKGFPLIMGTGTNNTAESIRQTQEAEKIGADGCLVVVPYYSKPPQRGLLQHFKAIAESTPLPVILYNVPGRTIAQLLPETIAELSKIKNIVGVKEASGNIETEKEIIRLCGPQFTMLSGDDETYVEFLIQGGHGVISVATHVIPAVMSNWKSLVAKGEHSEARNSLKEHQRLIQLLFCEANPIPVKAALKIMGLISADELRLPLVQISEKFYLELKKELTRLGLAK